MYSFFTHYRKPMARATSLLSRTAMPEGMKVATATQEFIRRLKNTSRLLDPTHMEEELEKYCADLKRGGFKEVWVKNCLTSIVKGYLRMVSRELKGEGKVNRPETSSRTIRRHRINRNKEGIKRYWGKISWLNF